MANEFIIRKGYKSLANSEITGSLNVTGDITGSAFKGDGSALTGVTAEWDGSHTGNASITGKLQIGNYWDNSNLNGNSIYVQNATDGFAFGVGTGISTWFSYSNTGGQNRMIDVDNDGTYILLRTGNINRVTINSTGATVAGELEATSLDINGAATFDTDVNTGGFITHTNSNAGNGAYTSLRIRSDVGGAEIWRNSSTRTQTGGAAQSFNIYNNQDTNIWSGGTRALHLDTSQNASFAGNATFAGDARFNSRVRIGDVTGLSNRGTVRIDTRGDVPADLLFGRDTDGTATSWNEVFWGISSRGSNEGNTFKIYRGTAHSSPYNTEAVPLVISPNLNASFANNVNMASGNVTGKFAVKSTGVHASYDFYNNGTSYFNSTTIVDGAFTQSGGLASSFSGNVTLGDAATDKTVIVGNLGIGPATYPKVVYPGSNAQWGVANNSTTGQVVIDLPGTLANYDMMYMEIDIYEYSSENATKLIIGGHNWNSGGDSNTSSTMWHNVGVTVLGTSNKSVYFGWRNDGTNNRRVIAIGEVTSTWNYGTVHVAKVSGQEGYATNIDWVGDWGINLTTSTSFFTKNPTTNYNSATATTFKTTGKIAAAGATFTNNIVANGVTLTGNQTLPTDFVSKANGGTFSGDIVVEGSLTAREFHTEFVSASIMYDSGSTKFGDTSDDTHDFTGSVNIDGEISADSFTGKVTSLHEWEWYWVRYADNVTPATDTQANWEALYKTSFIDETATEQDEGYVNTIDNVGSEGGFGGSSYGNIFGNLTSYHTLITTNIHVTEPFSVTITDFTGDDSHAIFINGAYVKGVKACCSNSSYSYTFTQGWHRIDLIYGEGGGGDHIKMGWNPKDYTDNISHMYAHLGADNPNYTLERLKAIDGAGSGLDADLLDGQEGSHYLDYNNFNNVPTTFAPSTSDTLDFLQDNSGVSLHQFNNSLNDAGGNYNATAAGASFGTGLDSKFGSHGLNTQGDGTYVDIAGLPTIQAVSIWYKAIGNDNGYIVDFRHDNPNNGRSYLYTLAGSDQYINMGNDTTTSGQTGDIWINGVAFTSGQYNFTSGNWYHIVVSTNTNNTKQTWDQGIRIGNRSDGTTDGNAGYFDQVRTFNRRLTSADVALLYAEVETGATADQTAGEILSLIKTVDGAGSGLDADLLDGQEGSHYLDYANFGTIPTWNQDTTGNATTATTATSASHAINSDQLNGFTLARIDHAQAFHTFDNIDAASTQAKRYHIGRLYGCPAHWDGNWQNIEFNVTAEGYESGHLRYRLMGDYGGAGSQANMMDLYLKEASGPMVGRFRFVLGTPVDAGWNHSGQDTYYVDLYAEASHYSQWKINIKTYGHGTQNTNPTSGGATTVFYDSPTASNISTFNEGHNTIHHLGDEIYHEGHVPTYAEIGQMDYTNLTGTIPTWNQDTTGTATTASNAMLLDGIDSTGFVAVGGDTMTGTLTSTLNGTALTMDGGASAEGIRMTADSSTTYPVFLRSIAASNGETSPWLYKENNTAWGIWHNNPVNSFDFTRSSNNLGIENNVGGQTNSVMIRLNNTDGSGIFKGNVTATTFVGALSGNATTATTATTATNAGNADTLDTYHASSFIRKGEDVDTTLGNSTDNRAAVLTLNHSHTSTFAAASDISDTNRVLTIQNPNGAATDGLYTALHMQVLGNAGTTRTMGDIKFVRESGYKGNWYFTSKDTAGNWRDGLKISTDGITVEGSGSTVFDVQGSQGQLFSITDDLTGDLLNVSDISGIPILTVNASGTSSFDGEVNISEGLTVTGSIIGTLAGTATTASNAMLLDGIDSSQFLRADQADTATSPISFTAGHGAINITNSSILSSATSNWTGDPGGAGKIQYHSNRWYIVSDSSSNRIVQFRRNGSDKSYIDNNGKFIGTATSADNADTVDSLHASSFLRSDAANSGVRITSGDGNSLRFWDSTNYMIYMSSAGNSTYGGRVNGETSSDYNMYFKMTSGTNRGFVFRNNTNNVAGIDSAGNGRFEGDVIAYASSDRRYKDNLVTIGNATEKVKQLSGYEFTWNNKQTVYPENTKDIGVVAQEVEKVLPELVTTRESGYKAVKYDKLTALLIEAVKEQQKQIDELKDLVMNLKNKK